MVAKTEESVREILQTVMDPEIPALSVIDMGIVRGVSVSGEDVTVTITPTYSACPAMKMIEDDIGAALKSAGFGVVHVKTELSPAWTTDWLSEKAKERLRESGMASPEKLVSLPGKKVACPRCGSSNTEERSFFGSTACKALYVCRSCGEPFDFFKPI